MLYSQRDKFDLPADVSYLNCANISPLSKRLQDIARCAIEKRANPYQITAEDWFQPAADLRSLFASLVNERDTDRIALIPSVSYGIATVCQNIKLKAGSEILLVGDEYPSNYYSWERLARDTGARLRIIARPANSINIGEEWNRNLLAAITAKTKVVALGNVHWMDGTLFSLEEISHRAKHYGALLIIDGSQSIGALPFDVNKLKPDATFCVGYKWLMGPFSLGVAHFGEYFDNGVPLEENWINRMNSDDFQSLSDHNGKYKPLSNRYNVGGSSSFHLLPVLKGAVEQLLEWGVENIQNYCKELSAKATDDLRGLGCKIEEEAYRAHHLFGIRFPEGVDLHDLHRRLSERKVYTSLRGTALRVSVNVYNTSDDLEQLTDCIRSQLNNHKA